MGFFSKLFGGAAKDAVKKGVTKAAEKKKKPKDKGYKLIQTSGAAMLVEIDGESSWNLPGPDGEPWGYSSQKAAQIPDVWGPLAGPQDLEQFALHMTQVDNNAMDPMKQLEIVQRHGYADMETYLRTKYTFLKHNGTGDPNGSLDGFHFGDNFTQAMMKASMQAVQEDMVATAAANPEMLAPIEGITVETYAACAAKQAAGLDQNSFLQLLAQYGMDMAMWDRVSGGWMTRMSQDTTATIATIYSKAFAGAGQGQYGAAAAATADANSGIGVMTGQAAGGQEPVPFEKLCEIQGAQTAWANTGKDVNAMLQQVFGITALDWSSMSMWWMTKMTMDVGLMQKYSDLSAKYEKQYTGGGGGGADSDISF